jgi:transposase
MTSNSACAAFCAASAPRLGRQNHAARFAGRIKELVAGHPQLEAIAKSFLTARLVLRREFNHFEKQVRALARTDSRVRWLMSVPGAGPIVALTFASAIDDPARFTSSKRVGPYFGLPPKNTSQARQTSMAASRRSAMPRQRQSL